MCLILFAVSRHPEYDLIVGANRDEFYDRPSAPLDFWEDFPAVLAGRDLQGMGTWMGVNTSGAFAAVTNVRRPVFATPDAPSRGHLVGDYLKGDPPARDYLARVQKAGKNYNGFNLIVGRKEAVYCLSNLDMEARRLGAGIYGLSNDALDTPWPKVRKGKDGLQRLIEKGGSVDPEALFSLLRDDACAPDQELPDTGVGDVWERILSPLFISSRIYGTRCSSVVLMEKTGRIAFYERTFEKQGDKILEGKTVRKVTG